MRRALPWIVGAVLGIAYFAIFETLGFTDPDHYATFSHTVASIGRAWPLAIYLFGLANGILIAHFFWPWRENPLGIGQGFIAMEPEERRSNNERWYLAGAVFVILALIALLYYLP